MGVATGVNVRARFSYVMELSRCSENQETKLVVILLTGAKPIQSGEAEAVLLPQGKFGDEGGEWLKSCWKLRKRGPICCGW